MKYQINKLYNLDCEIAMKKIPDKYFELAIVDPPYGINVTKMVMGGRNTIKPDKTKKWDENIPSHSYFEELNRISKNQIIWGGNYFDLPPSRGFIIWDKGETMYGRTFSECEFAWTSFDKVARIYKKSPNQIDRIHPTQKPISLYKWILQNYTTPGDKIIDTHVGSGSSLIACHEMGFDFMGFELDKQYFMKAQKRLEDAQAQINIFSGLGG